jgi:hypothetical protein
VGEGEGEGEGEEGEEGGEVHCARCGVVVVVVCRWEVAESAAALEL